MLGALTTHSLYLRYVWHLAVMLILLSEKRKLWNWSKNIGIASHRPWCSYNSANRLWNELNLWRVFPFFAGKALHPKPKCKCVSDLTAQHKVNSIVKEFWFYSKHLPGTGNNDKIWNPIGYLQWNVKLCSLGGSPSFHVLLAPSSSNHLLPTAFLRMD